MQRLRRGPGCFVCGQRGCHSVLHRGDNTPPQDDRHPSARDNERYREYDSGLNVNARVLTPL